MRNNLTPTVVTDKNGKVTTVHKKQETSASKASPLPAPTIPANKAKVADDGGIEIEKYDEGVGKRLYQLMEESAKRPMGMDKMVLVVRANNRQRALYADLLERKDGFWEVMNAATSSSLSPRERPGDEQFESIALVYDKDAFNTFPDAPKATKAQKQYMKLRAYIRVLSEAWKEPAITEVTGRKESFRLGELSPEAVEQVRSYVKLRSAVEESCPKDDSLLDGLLDVALHGEHSVDDVVKVVREHHTRDASTVLGILNGSSPAVANGWL